MNRRALLLALVLLLVGLLAGPAAGGSLNDDLKEVRQSILALAAQIDDVAAELGVDDPPQESRHRVLVGQRWRRGGGHGRILPVRPV